MSFIYSKSKLKQYAHRMACVLVVCSLLSIAFQADCTEPAPSSFRFKPIKSVKPAPARSSRASMGPRVFRIRGILLESIATITLDGIPIEIESARLQWNKTSDNMPVPCIGITSEGKEECFLVDHIPSTDTFRLAYWIATTENTMAFTLLPAESPFTQARAELMKDNYKKPSSTFSIPLFAFDSIEKKAAEGDTIDNILLHSSLDSSSLVDALGYIDFSDSNLYGLFLSGEILETYQHEQPVIDELNTISDDNLDGDLEDICYVNADIHSKFLFELNSRSLSGLPLRYYWTKHSNLNEPIYHQVLQFIDSSKISERYNQEFGKLHTSALNVFRITAVLRAFQENNPQSLQDFINEGVTVLKLDK